MTAYLSSVTAYLSGVSVSSGVDKDINGDGVSTADDYDSDSSQNSIPTNGFQSGNKTNKDTSNIPSMQEKHSNTKDATRHMNVLRNVCDAPRSSGMEQLERQSAKCYVSELVKVLPGN